MSEQDVVPLDWAQRLSVAVAASIREVAPQLGEATIVLLAFDCQPWHGSLELSALTQEEAQGDPLLLDPAEMAAWQHYNFSEGLASWQPAREMSQEMQLVYQGAPDKQAMAEAFLLAAARVMDAPEVVTATSMLSVAGGFRVSVTHPDTGQEFYHPQDNAAA